MNEATVLKLEQRAGREGRGRRSPAFSEIGSVNEGALHPQDVLRYVPLVLRQVRTPVPHRVLADETFATTVAFDFPGTLEEMLERATADTEEVDDDEQR